jgi:hypothetical protein
MALIAALSIGACSRPGGSGETSNVATGAGTSVLPTVESAARKGDTVVVTGRSDPEAIVRISSPEGQSWGATATPEGQWSFILPLGSSPRMFALTAEKSARPLRAESAIVILPAPALTLVLARAGYGAQSVDKPIATPVIVALDYDQGGGAMVSGLARAGSTVRLLVDDAPTGDSRADALGRFVVASTGKPLTEGEHRLRIETVDGPAVVDAVVSRPERDPAKVYVARHEGVGWRLDWRTAGGGVQSTLVLDSAAQALEGNKR